MKSCSCGKLAAVSKVKRMNIYFGQGQVLVLYAEYLIVSSSSRAKKTTGRRWSTTQGMTVPLLVKMMMCHPAPATPHHPATAAAGTAATVKRSGARDGTPRGKVLKQSEKRGARERTPVRMKMKKR